MLLFDPPGNIRKPKIVKFSLNLKIGFIDGGHRLEATEILLKIASMKIEF